MKLHHPIIACAVAAWLVPQAALAEGANNVCKPDPNGNNIYTVTCNWPLDTSVFPTPDIADCQAKLRAPESTSDDCGNYEFLNCMTEREFVCVEDYSTEVAQLGGAM